MVRNRILSFIDRHPLLFLSALALLVLLPPLILTDIPQRDIALRYAPLAQALVDGDWGIAFHPRIPPLPSLLGAGLIFLLGCGSFTAMKLVSAASFVLGILPLWGICRQVFNRRIAFWSCIFYIFCSLLLRLSTSGLRESLKTFCLLGCVYAVIMIYRDRGRFRNYLLFAVAAVGMCLTRDDSILFAGALGVFVLVLEIVKYRFFFWRSILAGVIGLMLFSPYLFCNYCMTGYPVPGIRAVKVVSGLLSPYCWGVVEFPAISALPGTRDTESVAPKAVITPAAENWKACGPAENGNKETAKVAKKTAARSLAPMPIEDDSEIGDFVNSLLKGVFYYFFIPALFVIGIRVYRKRWTTEETILLTVFLLHTLLIVAQIIAVDHKLYVSRRYLISAAPLYFGWTAMALLWGHRQLGRFVSRRWQSVIYALLMVTASVILYIDAVGPLIKQYGESKHALSRDTSKRWAEFIRNDYSGIRRNGGHEVDLLNYRTFFRPAISCRDLLELGFLAGGEGLEYTPEESVSRGLTVDYMVGEYRLNEIVPVFAGYEVVEIREKYKRRYVFWRRYAKTDQ